MNIKKEYKCLFDKNFTAVSLKYQEDKAEMLIVIPNNPKRIDSLIESLNNESLKTISLSLREQKIMLSLPKFTMKCDFELSDVLTKAGMGTSFSTSANFKEMSPEEGLYVSKVIHSTFIEVNETGTEAAAATAYIIGRSVSSNLQHIVLNHPFLYFIRDIKSGQLLFRFV